MLRPTIFIFLLIALTAGQKADWVNDYDGKVIFQCPDDQTIVHIVSRHDNSKEDRQFAYECAFAPTGVSLSGCTSPDYAADYHNVELFNCDKSGFITGIDSKHDNKEEDRKTKYYCCKADGYITHSCYYAGPVNDVDQYINYEVPEGYVLSGVMSHFESHNNDRRFYYNVCKLAKGK